MDNISLHCVQIKNITHTVDGGRKVILEVPETQIITTAKLSALSNDMIFTVEFKANE
jgi:hypothetical protein